MQDIIGLKGLSKTTELTSWASAYFSAIHQIANIAAVMAHEIRIAVPINLDHSQKDTNQAPVGIFTAPGIYLGTTWAAIR
jgi:hypothetical protein